MTRKFSTIKVKGQLSTLENCNNWLAQAGISVTNTRFNKILSILRIIVEYYEQNRVPELMHQYDEATLFYVLTDTIAFIEIYELLRDKKNHELPRKKLKEIINGPLLPWGEDSTDGTGHSRNTLFELETAAWFNNAGIEIEYFDDVGFSFSNHSFNVQCKRIHSSRNIADNVSAAADQLTKKMRNDPRMKGIICLSVDKLTETEGWIFEVSNENEIAPMLNEIANNFIKKFNCIWQNLININIIGVAIVLKVLSSIKYEPYPMLTTCRTRIMDIIPNKAFYQGYDYLLIKSLSKKIGALKYK